MIGTQSDFLLTAPPDALHRAREFGLPLGHMAYRVGGGPHLFRVGTPQTLRGGVMVVDAAQFDGRGEPEPFCREVLRECAARGFTGVLCDFEGPSLPLLGRILARLDGLLPPKGLTLTVTEPYAGQAPHARVLVSSAISGGSLKRRLEEAVQRYGRERAVLAVERVAEDFFLPAPGGEGAPLSREALAARLAELSPSVFFSQELCAHYFTYMSRENGAHFVLYDTAGSIRAKLQLARSCGVSRFALAWPEVDDLLPDILA